jgi:hypothetical protein
LSEMKFVNKKSDHFTVSNKALKKPYKNCRSFLTYPHIN